MSVKPKTLVTSAAGKTGLPTALQLLEKGYPVRAFVRRDDHRSRRLKEAGAELFVGDQYTLADMRRAMAGMFSAPIIARRQHQTGYTSAPCSLLPHRRTGSSMW